MFKFLAKRRERKVARLAREALTVAATDYADGSFEWIRSYEFKDGDEFHDATRLDRPEIRATYGDDITDATAVYGDLFTNPRKIYEFATGGCLLGGVARAAWKVCGEPQFNTPAWDLKLDVEIEADRLILRSMGFTDDDDDPDGYDDLEYQVRQAALGGGVIPTTNDQNYSGVEKIVEILEGAQEVAD